MGSVLDRQHKESRNAKQQKVFQDLAKNIQADIKTLGDKKEAQKKAKKRKLSPEREPSAHNLKKVRAEPAQKPKKARAEPAQKPTKANRRLLQRLLNSCCCAPECS